MKRTFAIQNNSGDWWTGACWGECWGVEQAREVFDSVEDLPDFLCDTEDEEVELHIHANVEHDFDARYYRDGEYDAYAGVKVLR